MSKQQKQIEKKKKRELEKQKKLLLQREAVTKKRQHDNEEFHKDEKVRKLQKQMGDLSIWADDVLKKVPDATFAQLQKNAKVLKALEEEYEEEQKKKRELNGQLESNGLLTLEDKLSQVNRSVLDGGILQEIPKQDVAEVGVIKANPENS